MPSSSVYTPLESLLFFQSLAGLDRRPETFASIADFLKNNPFVRENARFDANRLTPQALEDLYTDAIKNDGGEIVGRRSPDQQQFVNGQQDGSKSSPSGDGRSHSTVISGLVSRLYARYRELITKEIQEDEQNYRELQSGLSSLPNEHQAQASSLSIPQREPESKPTQPPESSQHALPNDSSVNYQAPPEPGSGLATPQNVSQPLQPRPLTAAPVQESNRPSPRQSVPTGVTQYRFENKTPQTMQAFHHPQWTGANHHIPITSQATPPAQSQPQNAGILIQPHSLPQTPASSTPPFNTHIAPAPASVTNARAQPISGQPSLPAAARPSAPRQAMQGRMIQPWSIHSPQSQQHASPYAISPYAQGPPPVKIQTPQPTTQPNNPSIGTPQIPFNVRTGPVASQPGTSIKPDVEASRPAQNTPQMPSTGITRTNSPALPLDLRRSLSVRTSMSRTPWKKPTPINIPTHPGSPVRPQPEDLSPVSETELSPVHGIPVSAETAKANLERPAAGTRNRRATPASRKGRSNSPVSPSTRLTRRRGRSNVSHGDETDGDKVKNELGTTLMELDDVEQDVSQRTSERRTRSTVSAADERARSKRKRSSSETFISEEPQTSSQQVICTRNFPRTCGPVMNDIAAHKHASIFAKPLTERDAPGYRNLIYRPQDIKSIKSAIHHGSKAVAAASETSTNDVAGTPKGNGLVLKKTAELIPPKGIVNSSQLEKELIRMFANAVMFNPTPESTFGHAFPMRSDFASRAQTQVSEPEEGGILHDTLEIYEDVERAVSTWRAAERAVDDMGGKGSAAAALRGNTGDCNNTEGMDDVK